MPGMDGNKNQSKGQKKRQTEELHETTQKRIKKYQ
jgi:hypothetical protein